MKTVRCILLLVVTIALLGGCHRTPVRHLASDATLIKAGVSTRDDVYDMLGDPDVQRMVSDSVEEWVYYEEAATSSHRTPIVGTRIEVPTMGVLKSKGYNMITLTIENDLVSDVKYNAYEESDDDWKIGVEEQEK